MEYIDESYSAQINKKVVLQVAREKILPIPTIEFQQETRLINCN